MVGVGQLEVSIEELGENVKEMINKQATNKPDYSDTSRAAV